MTSARQATPKSKEPAPQERAMLVTLYTQGQFAEAEAVAREMTASHPKHPLAWKVLGASLKKLGRTQESLPAMQKAALLSPRDHEAFNNLGVTLKDLGKTEQAIGCYRQALALKPDYAEAHGNLGAALREQGKLAEALASYKRKLALAPHDAETQHHVAALSGTTTEHAPRKYIEGVFDNYAANFDKHLTQSLRYSIPEQLAVDIQAHLASAQPATQRVLDLGCGTGLVAVALANVPCELTGVDVSAGMLRKARERGLYERLEQADLLPMMQGEPAASYDIVTSADVFIYVGRIDEVVAETRRVLRAGGLFAFSVESCPDEAGGDMGYRLETSGRYAHSDAYLAKLAATHGFTVVENRQVAIRVEQERPIMGRATIWRA